MLCSKYLTRADDKASGIRQLGTYSKVIHLNELSHLRGHLYRCVVLRTIESIVYCLV